MRASVQSFQANAELLGKIKVTLEDWLGMTDKVRAFKLKAAKAAK